MITASSVLIYPTRTIWGQYNPMWAVWGLDVRVCVCIPIYIYPCICLCKHVYMYPCITGMYMSIHACLCMHVYGVECLCMDVLTGYIPVFLCMFVYGCCSVLTRRARLVSGVHSNSTSVKSHAGHELAIVNTIVSRRRALFPAQWWIRYQFGFSRHVPSGISASMSDQLFERDTGKSWGCKLKIY